MPVKINPALLEPVEIIQVPDNITWGDCPVYFRRQKEAAIGCNKKLKALRGK